MAERIPQILKFVPHLNRRGVILVKRVYADENGPQLSAGVIRAEKGAWNVELDYPEITASFATLPIAQAFCQGYCAAKGWTIPPDGTTSDDDAQGAQDNAETIDAHLREYLALEAPPSVRDALAGRLIPVRLRKLETERAFSNVATRLDRLETLAELAKERLAKLEALSVAKVDFAHFIQRLEKLEAVAPGVKVDFPSLWKDLQRLQNATENANRRLEKLEKLAHEHFVNTEDVKPSPGR